MATIWRNVHVRQAGALPPLEQASPTNHGPYLVSASYTFMFLMVIVVLIRLATRFHMTRPKLDDTFLAVSAIFAVVQSVMVQLEVDQGLGRHESSLSSGEIINFSKASQLLSIGALLFSRLSVSALIEALRPGQAVILANRICAVLILCWGITSFFALAFQCSLPNPWLFNPRNTCIHRFALYASLDAIAMITDLTLIVVPVFVMRKVQVPLTKRATVILLFALRAVVIAATILKLKYSNQYFSNISVEAGGLTSAGRVENDATWGLLVPIVWRQAAMNLSVVSACLPSLKRILSDMRPGLNGVTIPHALELSLSNAFGQNGVRANLDSRNRSVQLEPGSSPSDSGSNGLKLSSGRRVSRGFPFGISSGGKNTTSVSTGSVAALREKDPFGIFLDLDSESMRQLREEGIVQKKDITVEIETMERRGSSSLSGGESEKTLVRETITSRLM